MPKVTIIIPCYNGKQYVERCLNGLAKQTFKDFDAIIIDDCSTDGTLAKLNALKEHYCFNIQILENSINLGPAESRNKGIAEASGEFIAFCDCDDWYENCFLEKMLSSVSKNSSDLVFCGYNVINDGKPIEQRFLKAEGPKTVRDALTLDCDSLCMTLVKSSIMKETLLPNIRNGEDMAVIPLLVQKANKVSVVPECLYNYFRRNNSASQVPNINSVYSLIDSFGFLMQHSKMDFKEELEFIGARNLLYASEITLFSSTNNKKLAERILQDFETTFPNWPKNKYLKNLPTYKRIVLKCLKWKMFWAVRAIAVLRKAKNR